MPHSHQQIKFYETRFNKNAQSKKTEVLTFTQDSSVF